MAWGERQRQRQRKRGRERQREREREGEDPAFLPSGIFSKVCSCSNFSRCCSLFSYSVLSFCSSCFLLCNKLTPKLSGLNQHCFITFHDFVARSSGRAWLGNPFIPRVIDRGHLVTFSVWMVWSGGSMMASLTCLGPWQGWLRDWARLEPSTGEPMYGISSTAVIGYLESLCGSSGLQEPLFPQTKRSCLAFDLDLNSRHVTSFVLCRPRLSQACPDSRGGDVGSDGRSLRESEVLIHNGLFSLASCCYFPL